MTISRVQDRVPSPGFSFLDTLPNRRIKAGANRRRSFFLTNRKRRFHPPPDRQTPLTMPWRHYICDAIAAAAAASQKVLPRHQTAGPGPGSRSELSCTVRNPFPCPCFVALRLGGLARRKMLRLCWPCLATRRLRPRTHLLPSRSSSRASRSSNRRSRLTSRAGTRSPDAWATASWRCGRRAPLVLRRIRSENFTWQGT